jgi:integrase
MKAITYGDLSAWLSRLSVDGSQAGTGLSASRIIQTHQLVGAVFNYAVKAGLATKNIAAEINRRHDLPETTEADQRYLTHPHLLDLAKETARFETLTLVLGYCGCRFGEAAALRRKDVGDREISVRASATYVAGQGIVETDSKTKWSRRVPVPEPVWERLRGELPTESDALGSRVVKAAFAVG